MRPLITTELLKLRSTRSAWIPLSVALVFAVLAVVANTSVAGHDGNPPLSPDLLPDLLRASGGQLVNGAVLLAWIVLSAGEFRHRTAVTTFLTEPRRLRVVSAKLAAAALCGLLVGLAAEAISAVTSGVALSANDIALDWGDPGVRRAIVVVPLLAAVHGMIGVGLGLCLRNTAAALGVALMWAFVVEGVLPAITGEPGLVRWLPGGAAYAALQGGPATAVALSAGAAVAVLAGYAVLISAAGAAVTSRAEVGTAAD